MGEGRGDSGGEGRGWVLRGGLGEGTAWGMEGGGKDGI